MKGSENVTNTESNTSIKQTTMNFMPKVTISQFHATENIEKEIFEIENLSILPSPTNML